ncbi:Uncharacterised protein [Shewanella putrefaciens]|nr:hypothetical protein SPWS13_2784 [Shewanella putrefaciens]MDR6965776.1 hypothetical protein [Shewanella putrefaciens]SUI77244.1 Uncharacterised protein [Shewanella putrefaciens]
MAVFLRRLNAVAMLGLNRIIKNNHDVIALMFFIQQPCILD